MKRISLKAVQALCLSFIFSFIVYADVSLPAILSDGMVLQQGMPVPLWGSADEGETITVLIQNQKVSTVAQDGRWMVRLRPLRAGGPFALTITGKNKIEMKNVLVGEVWICSGQSNMQWTVKQSANAETEIAGAKYPMIRLFSVPRVEADAPLKDVKSAWKECSSESVADFSAVGYFFGRHLHQKRNVPVGLINSSFGGTPAEAWTSEPVMAADAELKTLLDEYPGKLEAFRREQEEHREAAAAAKAQGKPVPRAPGKPRKPASLYNGMIAPLIPFAIKGAIWYQGESNASRAWQYRRLFPAMIRNWRTDWAQGNFPFLFVQLAAYQKPPQKPEESDWAELREAQLLTLSLPNTGMAVAIDVGEEDIHPVKKQPVGERLALAARAIAYQEKLVYSGPIYQSLKVEGNKAILSFNHTGSGLEARDGELKGFWIAGEDKLWREAKAEIKGRQVIVSSTEVNAPVAVRYGWAKYPICNLYNREGLPASPFRTDQWKGITQPGQATASR